LEKNQLIINLVGVNWEAWNEAWNEGEELQRERWPFLYTRKGEVIGGGENPNPSIRMHVPSSMHFNLKKITRKD